mgnify:CR=1 FL=1
MHIDKADEDEPQCMVHVVISAGMKHAQIMLTDIAFQYMCSEGATCCGDESIDRAGCDDDPVHTDYPANYHGLNIYGLYDIVSGQL